MPTCRSSLAVVLLFLSPSLAAQTWQSAPSVPTGGAARVYGAAVRQGSQIFLLGGTPWVGGQDGAVDLFNGTAWSSQIALEGQVQHVGAALDGLGRIIVFGGQDPSGDPGEDYEWNVLDGNNGSIASRSAQAPNQLFAVAVDSQSRVYSIGGGAGGAPTTQNPNSTRVERYDAVTDSWTVLAPLPAARADGAAAFDGSGHIVFIGGFDGSGVRTGDVFVYDIATDSWSSTTYPSMPAVRSGHRAVRGADDRIYVVGGSDGATQATTFILDPLTATWTIGPALAVARRHFGLVLDAQGFIWAIGGANDALGTNTAEKLFTPTCPIFAGQPTAQNAYAGAGAGFSVVVSGTAPFTYLWRKDGTPLVDGPAAGGGTIAGAATAQLGILAVAAADIGSYDCVVTNACGTSTSAAATLTLVAPTPIPSTFTAIDLHPAGRLSSIATSVDGGIVVGNATYTHPQWNTLNEPVLWSVDGGSPMFLTPANSVGGSARAVANGTIVGWWWWPYTNIYGTGYYKRACKWTGTNLVHADIQVGGYEIGEAYDTDGTHHAGTHLQDETSYNATPIAWGWNSSYGAPITPPTAWGGGALAVDQGRAYGGVHWGYGVVHAVAWPMGGAPAVDINPPGASSSYVYGAGGGQQVGRATIAGVNHGGVWSGTASSFNILTPPGATSSEVNDCEGGLQVGLAPVGGAAHAALWAGNAVSFVDLHVYLPSQFSASHAYGIDVDANGVVTVVGQAYNTQTARQEAIVWRGNRVALTANTGSLSATAGGTYQLTIAAGAAFSGRTYAVAGSLAGTDPGIVAAPGVVVPLLWDSYTTITVSTPDFWLSPSFGSLDVNGQAVLTGILPPGLVSLGVPISVYHAAVVVDAGATGIAATTNAATLILNP